MSKPAAKQREPMREPMRQREQPPTDRVVARDRAGNPIWRRTRSNDKRFHIDPAIIPPDWSWEWKRHSIYNQEDKGYATNLALNGWRPVMAEDYPGLFLPASASGPIVLDGLMLMERPLVLTEEARAEDRARANGALRAVRDQIGMAAPAAASGGRIEDTPRNTYVRTYEEHNLERPKLEIE